jgi:hypothetical protein
MSTPRKHRLAAAPQVGQARRVRDGVDLPGVQPAVVIDADLGVGDQAPGNVAQRGVQVASVLGQQRVGIVRELQRVEHRAACGLPRRARQQVSARVGPAGGGEREDVAAA